MTSIKIVSEMPKSIAEPSALYAQDSVGVTAGLLFLRLGFSRAPGVVGLI